MMNALRNEIEVAVFYALGVFAAEQAGGRTELAKQLLDGVLQVLPDDVLPVGQWGWAGGGGAGGGGAYFAYAAAGAATRRPSEFERVPGARWQPHVTFTTGGSSYRDAVQWHPRVPDDREA